MSKWLEPRSSVLDLGCGEGELLEELSNSLAIKGYGIEIGNKNIEACLKKGLNIIQQDIDDGLENIGTKSFETVILSETIHVLKKPDQALKEITTKLRALPTPIIGRLQNDSLWLDLRCLENENEFLKQISMLRIK